MTQWVHSDPFMAGTLLRADRHNVKLNGIAQSMAEIYGWYNKELLRLPSNFTGNNQMPDVTYTNSLICFTPAGDLNVYNLDTFDAAVQTAITKASEALASANSAATSESNSSDNASSALTSKNAAGLSETNSKSSEDAALISKNAAKTSETNSKTSETNSKNSEDAALISKNAAKTSETKSKTSETNSQNSEDAALISKNTAKESETKSKTSETNSKNSENAAAQSALEAQNYATGTATNADKLGQQLPSYYENIPARLGFTPIQQGGGTGQGTNKIYIGWGSSNALRLQVDSTNFGSIWPITSKDTQLLEGVSKASIVAEAKANTVSTIAGVTNQINVTPGQKMTVAGEAHAAFSVFQPTLDSDAFICFHIAGNYAAYFGIDGTTQKWSVGGFSMGSVKYALYHEGNETTPQKIGALAEGSESSANVANKIVKRDSSSDISSRLFRSEFASQGTINGAMAFRMSDGSDNYIRFCSSQLAIRTWLESLAARINSNWNDGLIINNVVGLLAWKNYGNNHVVFDASAGTSPSGRVINNSNPESVWAPSYPTLMGCNGSGTYGVKVDRARYAETLENSTVKQVIKKSIVTHYTAGNITITLGDAIEHRVMRWGTGNGTITISGTPTKGDKIIIDNIHEASGKATLTGKTMYTPDGGSATTHTFTGKGQIEFTCYDGVRFMMTRGVG